MNSWLFKKIIKTKMTYVNNKIMNNKIVDKI